jgi:arylsulfatase
MAEVRRRRWWWAAVAAVCVLLGAAGAARLRSSGGTGVPPTTGGGEIAALREALEGANVVVCVLDAARADHLGCYGYPRDTTPNLDRLASESVLFRNHVTQHTATKPSTVSLFTGLHPDTHLAYGSRLLPEDAFTLARGLRETGLRTVMFSANPNASPEMGLGLDFEEVFDQRQVESRVGDWRRLTDPKPLLDLIGEWLSAHTGERFFAYVHLDPPHQPYVQPDAMTKEFAGQKPPGFERGRFEFPVADRDLSRLAERPPLPEWINLYDANLRYADWAVGELVKRLRDAGVLESTLLIVTADHGEAFGEHGYVWHERGVYEELVHIPLLVRFPRAAKVGEVNALTQTVDVLPTVFDLVGKRYPETVQGKSLVPVLAGQEEQAHTYVYARSSGKPPSYLVRDREWALMLWGNGKWRALYDLRADPGQRRNVIAQNPEVAARMVGAFREFAARQARPPLEFVEEGAAPAAETGGERLPAETRRRLKALGYVE